RDRHGALAAAVPEPGGHGGTRGTRVGRAGRRAGAAVLLAPVALAHALAQVAVLAQAQRGGPLLGWGRDDRGALPLRAVGGHEDEATAAVGPGLGRRGIDAAGGVGAAGIPLGGRAASAAGRGVDVGVGDVAIAAP